MNKTIQNALIAADRLFEIMDLERENDENKIDFRPEMTGDIRYENVSFSYGTRVDVFDDFSLTIPKGHITAIIGESGSGKTTLSVLLQKLYALNKGSISIGEYNIDYFTNQSLRQFVSAVPQQLDLFAGNVVENIAVGEFVPDMERVLEFVKPLVYVLLRSYLRLNIHWENGAQLSGGQRQRLAIARALYRNPEILILDEATSSLDAESESYVQKTIRQLRDMGKTIVIIAHRLSTVIDADKIVVLEEGKLIEEGTHEKLYSMEKKYYQQNSYHRSFLNSLIKQYDCNIFSDSC